MAKNAAQVGPRFPQVETPPPVRLYEPGSWGPKSIHQLVAPHAWRLPFERAWRDPNGTGS